MKRIKTGGRAMGVPNKITGTVKERISKFIDDNFDSLQEEFDKLDSKDKLSFFKDLLPYITAKMQSVQTGADVDLKVVIDFQE